jgi:hypothetical protein
VRPSNTLEVVDATLRWFHDISVESNWSTSLSIGYISIYICTFIYIIHIYIYFCRRNSWIGTIRNSGPFLGWERGAELLLLPPILGNPFFGGPPHPKVGSNRRYFHGPGCFKPRQMVKVINLWAKS